MIAVNILTLQTLDAICEANSTKQKEQE